MNITSERMAAIHERIAAGDKQREIAAQFGISQATVSRIKKAMQEDTKCPMLVRPGAYPHVAAEDYHRNPNLLPGPSLSSSGAKTILTKSAYHFWFDSVLNPNRPPEKEKGHFNIGKAAHDALLLGKRWKTHYHILPEGFGWNKTKQFAEEIAQAERARKSGKSILTFDEAEIVRYAVAAVRRNQLAVATLTNGVTEETLVWQDPETGVWLRARPDFRPNSIVEKRDVMVVSDLKFVAPTHASEEGFSKAIHNFGYHQSAAFYMDGIKAVYGHYPTHWVHVVVEKPEQGVAPQHSPMSVSLYELPGEDIERGRLLNRIAINKFAECLKSGIWPSYADEPKQVGLPIWARMQIEASTAEYAYSAAA